MKKVIVGLSGGVDSSVAALLLLEQGYHVEAIIMKNWEDDDNGNCQSEADFAIAQQVCAKLNIKLHFVNFAKEYKNKVFNITLDQFKKGLTPNPDILCNKEIKFNYFLKYALQLGADFIATGHYASIESINGMHYLYKSRDQDKDQTYFLYTITQPILEKTLFPLSNLVKSEVRKIAYNANLPTYNIKDSTGICFIGEKDFKQFLSTYLLKKPGNIIDIDGNILGRHDGVMFYTIGQRAGLKLGGIKGYPEKPWYVLDKNISSNEIVVGQDINHPLLQSNTLIGSKLHLISKDIKEPISCNAKIRYRQDDQLCKLYPSDHSFKVVFEKNQRAITPGQSIVFYNEKVCLGGGFIDKVIKS